MRQSPATAYSWSTAMIDRLILRAYFRPSVTQRDLSSVRAYGFVEDGAIYGLGYRWESIPTSFSGVAFRVFWEPQFNSVPGPCYGPAQLPIPELLTGPRAGQQWCPFVEIQASPAKVSQGHNVWGSDNLADSAEVLIGVFAEAFPEVFDALDHGTWEVVECDVTFHTHAASDREAQQFIAAISNLSYGQTRSRTGYDSTAYFGQKNSRLRKLKVYLKGAEVKEQLARMRDQLKRKRLERVITPQFLDYCVGMIRFEATLKSRWFWRRQIPTDLFSLCKVFDAVAYWREAFADIFKLLSGQKVAVVDDENVELQLRAAYGVQCRTRDGVLVYNADGSPKMRYTKANAVLRLYRAIRRDGYAEAKRTFPRSTWYDNLLLLCSATDISLMQLQNMGPHGTHNVIPLLRFIEVEFSAQRPAWASVA